jgi:nitrogen regulatory protein P-II 1
MKKITAVIRPHKLDEVKNALLEKGIKGMTVLEVRGIGKQKGKTEVYRGAEYQVDFIPKVQIDVVVPDDKLDAAVAAIIAAAKTGQIGDGKLFISTLDDVIRVRTEESGENALD